VYRLVLCLKYLMSRWLTLVAVGAVFLGVGPLVVTMAIMDGFLKEVRQACRGALSDVIIDSDVTGFPYYDQFIDEVRKQANVAAATPVVQLLGLARIKPDPETLYEGTVTRGCMIYGVRPEELAEVSKFSEYLQRQRGVKAPTFDVPEAASERARRLYGEVRPACIPGIELVSYQPPRAPGSNLAEEGPPSEILTAPGSRILLTTFPIGASGTLETSIGGAVTPRTKSYTVVDYYKSKLYDFDVRNVFMPFQEAQILGELGDPEGKDPQNPPRAHQIRIRLRDYGEAQKTIAELERMWERFRADKPLLRRVMPTFQTWEEKQAMLLRGYEFQRTLSVIVVGLIVIVAGFLIGAILTMIAKEKTRDVGILKALGAPSGGVATVFLAYGGAVATAGAVLGLVAGKVFIHYLDPIAAAVSKVLGFDIFSHELYYFERIPRYEDPFYTAVAVVGGIAWAVLCSTVAAYRAARLQPVEALRYE
jgi:lipoprotein-releasing system permease protein